MDYLLDTNIFVTYSRDNDISRRVEKDLKLFSSSNRLAISAVVLGELESLIIKSKLGVRRRSSIAAMLKRVAVVDVNIQELISRYGAIDAFSQGKLQGRPVDFSARNMGKNDLWIAATASLFGVPLVTMDRDFDHLHGHFIDLRYVNVEDYQ